MLDDSDFDLEKLGIDETGNYVYEQCTDKFVISNTVSPLYVLDIKNLLASNVHKLPPFVSKNVDRTVSEIVNSRGLFTPRIMWADDSVTLFLRQYFADKYDDLLKSFQSSNIVESCRSFIINTIQYNTPITCFELQVCMHKWLSTIAGVDMSIMDTQQSVLQIDDYSHIKYLTMRHSTRAYSTNSIINRLKELVK